MSISTWNSIATGLGVAGVLLAGCDLPEDPDLPGVPPPATSDGGEPEPDDDDPPADTDDEPPPADSEACSEHGATQACTTEQGEAGTQYCDAAVGDGAWGPCAAQFECTPGESRSCFCDDEEGEGGGSSGGDGWDCDITEQCQLYGGVPGWDSDHDSDAGCNTPLVLSFDGSPAELVPARAATFDLDGIGGCVSTDWPAASTPWLALDVDGNGTIESGRELFGSGTRLRSGARAAHGFAALAELDDDGDGRIDASDEAFSRLVLWGDDDGDRRSTFAEAQPLSHFRILSIELGYHVDRQCDARGNCGVERAAFHFVDEHGAVRQGEVVDLHLACQ